MKKTSFSWIRTHQDIVDFLIDKEESPLELIEILKSIGICPFNDKSSEGNHVIELREIDPFTFFCYLYKYGSESVVKLEQTPTELDKVTYQYEYNDKNQIIKDIRYGIGGTKLIHGYSYDEFGNITELISFDEDGKPAVKLVYEYGK